MYLIALTQGAISYTMTLGQLKGRLWHGVDLFTFAQYSIRAILLLMMTALWLLDRKRALFRVIIVANSLFTVVLLTNTGFLMAILAGLSSRAVGALIADVVLMGISNILVFSIWYWIIVPAGRNSGTARPATVGLPLSAAWQRHTAIRVMDSSLWRLPLHCLHDQLCVQSHRCDAAHSNRQDADADAVGHFRGHPDRDRWQRDQHPRRRWLTQRRPERPCECQVLRQRPRHRTEWPKRSARETVCPLNGRNQALHVAAAFGCGFNWSAQHMLGLGDATASACQIVY